MKLNHYTRYRIYDQNEPQFITISTIAWLPAFEENSSKEIIVDSLRYCQEHKGLVLHAWVVMKHHIHYVCRAREGCQLSNIIRDHKRHTSTAIRKKLEGSSHKRDKRMLDLFYEAGIRNSRNNDFQLWRNDNHPLWMFNSRIMLQKVNYIHANPVKAGIVTRARDYPYCSARDYSGGIGKVKVELV